MSPFDHEQNTDPPTSPAQQPSDEETTLPPAATPEEATLPPNEYRSSEVPTVVGGSVRYFGDYELIDEIARGGMGVVYKARQINLNRIVALKMVLAGQFAGTEDVQRFYAEAEAAAQLDHPGIVPIFEIGEHQGQHYFSMGYIEGESLAQRVIEGPLPAREAAGLTSKICEAMSYAHQRGVIHRDLKPANVLIDRTGQPKVTDFGLAKKSEADSNLTGTGQILGTPAYMPPEQAAGRTEDVRPLADIYSTGAILYCLLTGRPPHQAASPMDTLLQVLEQEPVSPRQLNSSVPQDLESVCLKCLQKNPAHRYQTCAALGDDLSRFLAGEPTKARPIGSFRNAWNWYWHNLRKVAGALAIACCAFYAISSCVGFTLTLIALSRTSYWGILLMIPQVLIVLTVVLIGSKCGMLTLRGHRLSLFGSILALGFIAYTHISVSLQSGLDVERFLANQTSFVSTSYAHTLSVWFIFCIATQVLALFATDRGGGGLSWREDVANLRRNGPALLRPLALIVIGALVMQVGGSPLTPRGWVSLAGAFCVASGLLSAMRIR